MQTVEQAMPSFAYRAQTRSGEAISGTLEAPDVEEATRHLESLQLRILQIDPVRIKPATPRALKGDDFVAFNQQLGYLTQAGLPMEHGLRLIAEDMRSGRLSQTVRQIASELESGASIGEAFARHKGQFPSLYGRLLDAGVRSNNLPGILFSLSRHLELTRRLRGMLWRAFSYPLMVFVGASLVTIFLSVAVVPQFQAMFAEFKVRVPPLTQMLIGMSFVLPTLLTVFLAIVLAFPILWWMLQNRGWDWKVLDALVVPMPLIGPIIRRSLISAWCDAMRLAVEAGLDLPAAIELAGDATGSSRLRNDGAVLIGFLKEGKDLEAVGAGQILPPMVTAAMALSMRHHDLAETLRSLSEMYQQQAEMRLSALPGILTPLLLLLMAGIIGFIILALMMPLINLLTAVSGGKPPF